MAAAHPVFLDTSILIASVAHSPETKRRIQQRLGQHDEKVTGLVVRQEVKRRLLKDAQYLLGLLDRYGSITQVRRHLTEKLPPQQQRKRNICEQLITTVDEEDKEEDVADRLRLFLESLLRDGMEDFAAMVTRVVGDSNCGCARQPVRRRTGKTHDYDFGTDRCSRIKQGNCGIVAFLCQRRQAAQAVHSYLAALPAGDKTEELKRAEEFLREVINNEHLAVGRDPCLTVGDLLIALESHGVPHFYTLNAAESRHLCSAMGQTLIVRRKNPDHEDEICPPAPVPPE
jgi:hypothetical protein